ncbi:hypothetical protein JXA80_12830 [bacterium]|nr:hypothetical protein [candidate division CSSED10-310 bacterium]
MKWSDALILVTIILIGLPIYADESICDIRQGIGVQPGDAVTITGICTVPTNRMGGFLTVLTQDGGGPWCSISVYDEDQSLSAEYGQCVTLTGVVVEYYEKTELVLQSIESVWDCGWQIPDPIRVPPPICIESLENSTIVIEGVTVIDEPDEYGNVTVIDRYGTEWIWLMSKTMEVYPSGTQFCGILAFIDFHFNEYKVRLINETAVDERPHDSCPWMGTACDDVAIRQFLSHPTGDCFQVNDRFHYTVTWTNLCHARPAYLFVILQIGDFFFFYPAFSSDLNYTAYGLPELGSLWWDALDFAYPGGAGGISCRWYAIALDPGTLDLISEINRLDFCLD